MDTFSESQLAIYRQAHRERLNRQVEQRESWREKTLAMVKETVPSIAESIVTVNQVFLFGSITKPGLFRPESDVDIAVTGTTATDYFTFWRKLEEALPEWQIDCRDVSDNSFFATWVKETGTLIYERSSAAIGS